MEVNQIYKKAKTYGVPVIRTESHKILADTVKQTQPKHILEIGTAVGYSGTLMLQNSSADLITIEHNKDYKNQAVKNFKANNLSNRVKVVFGDCLVEISKMLTSKNFDNYFDLIFLDGPKAQYDLLLEGLIKMLKPDGTLIVDNVLFRGYVNAEETAPTRRYKTIIKRLNTFIENCKNNPHLCDFNLINTEDGIILAKKVQNEK
jgi:caffeoyl-CoA O-methyltransferase